MSPYIDYNLVKIIVDTDTRIRVLTKFKHTLFACRESSLSAIEHLLSSGADVRSLDNIQSKTFIFDKTAIVVSSIPSPLNPRENIEYGFLIKSSESVKKVQNDFESLFNTGIKVSKQRMEVAGRVLRSLNPKRRSVILEFLGGTDTQETPPSRQLLVDSLGGWIKEVFTVIDSLPRSDFRLEDLYNYESIFRKKYPGNFNIDAKIRQTLQYLRDMDLIEFIDYQGTYRRR